MTFVFNLSSDNLPFLPQTTSPFLALLLCGIADMSSSISPLRRLRSQV